MKQLRPFIIVFSGLLLSYQASAKVYKWIDAEGNAHYSEKPSVGQANQVIKIKTGHSDAVDSSASSSTSVSAAASSRPAQQAAAQPEKDPAACASARSNLKTLQDSTNVKVVDDKGQHRYLVGNEWQEKVDEAQRVIAEQCE